MDTVTIIRAVVKYECLCYNYKNESDKTINLEMLIPEVIYA